MTFNPSTSRRRFLRGAGGLCLALPFLESLRGAGTARAAEGVAKRLIIVYSPHGRAVASNSKWRPEGTGPDFTLGQLMTPLSAFKEQMIVVSGLENSSAKNISGNGHSKGSTHALTCIDHLPELIPGDTSLGPIGLAGGISIDQKIANALAQDTPSQFSSLQFGVQGGVDFAVAGAVTRSYMSYAGPGEPLPVEDNPEAMFDKLFADFSSDPLALQQMRARRRSVLDYVIDDLERLQPSLSADDRVRVEQHLDHVREVEASIDLGGSGGSPACAVPEIDGYPADFRANGAFPAVGALQNELLAMALTCGLAPVATLQWSTGQSRTRHAWIPAASGDQHHTLTHAGSSAHPAVDAITQWYAGRVADLLATLQATPDEDGNTMLDSTIVLWIAGEHSFADAHRFDDMPYVLFGGTGLLQKGQHLVFNGRSTNDLFVTLQSAFGIDDGTFGDPQWVSGPLPGVLI